MADRSAERVVQPETLTERAAMATRVMAKRADTRSQSSVTGSWRRSLVRGEFGFCMLLGRRPNPTGSHLPQGLRRREVR